MEKKKKTHRNSYGKAVALKQFRQRVKPSKRRTAELEAADELEREGLLSFLERANPFKRKTP